MENGFVGILTQIPDKYRCYILYLQSDVDLKTPAEKYIMRHFWEVANSVSADVLFSGIVRGTGLNLARETFGVNNSTEAVIVILDIHPNIWKKKIDPIVILPLNKLIEEYEILEFLHLLVSISKKENFMGKLKRKQSFDKTREFLSYIPKLKEYIN